MGQRPRNQQPFNEGEKSYKYRGSKDDNIRPHEQCEMEQDKHVVMVTTWPPRLIGNQKGEPYIDARCEDCGAWLQVYAGHATGEMPGIKVILPPTPTTTSESDETRQYGPRIGRGPGRPRKDAVSA